MKAIKKIVLWITALLRQPMLAGAVLHDDRYWKARFKRRFGHTNPLPLLPFSRLVPDEDTLNTYTFLGGGSMITDLLLLKNLAHRGDVHTYFEIGTWRGESLSAVLPFIDHAFSLDLDDRHIDAYAFPDNIKSQMSVLIDDKSKVTFFKENSAVFDFSRVGRKCDLIFIDGNHTHQFVLNDTRAVLNALAHERSIIVWHDYGRDPESLRWEVYHGILEAVPASLHTHLYHVSNTKCAILIRDAGMQMQRTRCPQDVHDRWEVTIRRKE